MCNNLICEIVFVCVCSIRPEILTELYYKLSELPGFARDSRGIIILVLVAVFPQFNM